MSHATESAVRALLALQDVQTQRLAAGVLWAESVSGSVGGWRITMVDDDGACQRRRPIA